MVLVWQKGLSLKPDWLQEISGNQYCHKVLKYITFMVAVAQLVEHRIVAPEVAGSIPVGHPRFFLVFQGLKTSPSAGFFSFWPRGANS